MSTTPEMDSVRSFESLKDMYYSLENFVKLNEQIGYWRLKVGTDDDIHGTPHPKAVEFLEQFQATLPADCTVWKFDQDSRTVTLDPAGREGEAIEDVRSEWVDKSMEFIAATGEFPRQARKRHEKEAAVDPDGNVLFRIERSDSAVLGLVGYTVFMIAYTPDNKLVISTRSATKETYPNCKDVTVGGGVTMNELKMPDGTIQYSLMDPLDVLVKEAAEEASMNEDFVRKNAQFVRLWTYSQVNDTYSALPKTGPDYLVLHDAIYFWTVNVDDVSTIRPGDTEVASFDLYDPEQVLEMLKANRFKPNSGVCVLIFLYLFFPKLMAEHLSPEEIAEIDKATHPDSFEFGMTAHAREAKELTVENEVHRHKLALDRD